MTELLTPRRPAHEMSTSAIRTELLALLRELNARGPWMALGRLSAICRYAVENLDPADLDPRNVRALELAQVFYHHPHRAD